MSAGGRRSRLLAVWLLLVTLVGAIVVIERTDFLDPKPRRDRHGRVVSEVRLLLPVPMDQLGALEIVSAGTLHRFARDAAGAWFYHVHGAAPGSAAHPGPHTDPSLAERIEYAFAAFGRTRIERQFALKTKEDSDGVMTPEIDYGVTPPQMLIRVYRPRDMQPLVQYAVGDIAPDTLSRYVRVVGSAAVATIPNYQIDNLLALIEVVAGKSE